MKTCKHCKHWFTGYYAGWNEGKCNHGVCLCPKLGMDLEEEDSLSVNGDGGGWRGLSTGQDFGCIHFAKA